MFLIPGTLHVVRWTKQNLLDDTTYYPYAIVRDTRAGTILSQFALDQIATGRFSKNWNVVLDGSGFGREVEVEITIYEDAAHTLVSAAYGRWTDTYTVFDFPGMLQGGLGGGSQIDYQYIEKLIVRAVNDAIAANERDEVDLSEVESKLDGNGEIMSELLTEILQLGDKVERAAQIEKTMMEMCKGIIAALEKAPGDLEEPIRKAREAVGSAIKDSVDKAVAVLDAREGQIAAKTDEELGHIVDQFKKVIEGVAGSISEEIKQASENLRKPLSVKFEGMDVVSGEKKQNPERNQGGDDRANHMVSMME